MGMAAALQKRREQRSRRNPQRGFGDERAARARSVVARLVPRPRACESGVEWRTATRSGFASHGLHRQRHHGQKSRRVRYAARYGSRTGSFAWGTGIQRKWNDRLLLASAWPQVARIRPAATRSVELSNAFSQQPRVGHTDVLGNIADEPGGRDRLGSTVPLVARHRLGVSDMGAGTGAQRPPVGYVARCVRWPWR